MGGASNSGVAECFMEEMVGIIYGLGKQVPNFLNRIIEKNILLNF